jgi:hypothetical protein
MIEGNRNDANARQGTAERIEHANRDRPIGLGKDAVLYDELGAQVTQRTIEGFAIAIDSLELQLLVSANLVRELRKLQDRLDALHVHVHSQSIEYATERRYIFVRKPMFNFAQLRSPE